MTTYSSISNAALAVGAIPSSSVVTALRDNPIAMAEAASGAPINVAGWHPVDKVTVGDGKTGLIYDVSTSGAVGSVVTPDFEDGYEYRVVAHMLSHNSGSSAAFYIEGYLETDAAYALFYADDGFNNFDEASCDAEFLFPRIPSRAHFLRLTASANTVFSAAQNRSEAYDFTIQKVLRARIRFSSGSIDAGKVWFFRRREYASSP
jgi:hypothetical protein